MTALVGNTTQDNHAAAVRVNDPRFQITGPANKMSEARCRSGSVCSLSSPRRVCAVLFTNTSAGLRRWRGWPEHLQGQGEKNGSTVGFKPRTDAH